MLFLLLLLFRFNTFNAINVKAQWTRLNETERKRRRQRNEAYSLLLSLWIPCSICYFPSFFFLLPSSSSSSLSSSSTIWFIVSDLVSIRIDSVACCYQFHAKIRNGIEWHRNGNNLDKGMAISVWGKRKKIAQIAVNELQYLTWLIIIFHRL